MDNCRGNYRGLMSIPAELSLVSKDGQYHLKFQPVRELQAVLSPIHQLEKGKNHTRLPLNGTQMANSL